VTKFEKVLNHFCERQKLDVETQHLAISLDGEHIDGAVELSCCADDYDLRDGAILYACDGNVKHQRMSSLRCGLRYGGEKTAAAREADGRDSAEKPKKAHADENADVINADEESIIVALPSHLALALRADEELGAQTAAGAAMPYAGVSYTALLDLYAPKQAPLASGWDRLLPIRPRARGERHSLRTFPVVAFHPHLPFNVRLTGDTRDWPTRSPARPRSIDIHRKSSKTAQRKKADAALNKEWEKALRKKAKEAEAARVKKEEKLRKDREKERRRVEKEALRREKGDKGARGSPGGGGGGGGGETASHTTPFAWWTPILKDFSRRHSSPALPFQRLTGKTFDW
jgi:hypothetical protein